MKYKILLIIAGILMYSGFVQAQHTGFRSLKIGDSVPAYALKGLINYPEKTARLTDFKGKILILDFWSFGCVACVESWPKLIQLQQEFKDQIQIITANIYKNEKEIQAYLDKREKIFGYKMTLPMSCGDTDLIKLFPHTTVPHVIMVSKEGKIRYISAGTYLNKETIKNIIAGKEMAIPEKTDHYAPVNWSKPLYVNGNGGTELNGGKLLWSSMIKAYSSNFSATTEFMSNHKSSSAVLANMTVKDMFRLLYGTVANTDGTQVWIPNGRTALLTADTSNFVAAINGNTAIENYYTLQVTAGKEFSTASLKRKMITELEQYFGLKTGLEKQKRHCLVVSSNQLPIKAYIRGERKLQVTSALLNLNKVTIKEMFERFFATIRAYNSFPYPIIDETGFDGYLGDIQLEANVSDFKALGSALKKYGLEFSIQEREVELLVIRDKP